MSDNPFIRFRHRLDSYQRAADLGLGDSWFVDTVSHLDRQVAAVDGAGFTVTPIVSGQALADAADLSAVELWIKDETANVAGSHKARHLFGVALHLLVDAEQGRDEPAPLAIASCGNAAMAAGVMAAALGRRLLVFVPTWADRPVVERLHELGADVTVCERRAEDPPGDPAYLRYREAVTAGARPFTVQGTESPTTFDGGRTLGWELADQVPDLDAVYIQVGGGALATSVSRALGPVKLYPVQAEGCAPLARAWTLLAPDFDLTAAAESPNDYMWPWEPEPSSAATGILDDITYDWLALTERTRSTGGRPIVVPETGIVEAHRMAYDITGIPVSATGTAGLAGLIHHGPTEGRVAVAFTGVAR